MLQHMLCVGFCDCIYIHMELAHFTRLIKLLVIT